MPRDRSNPYHVRFEYADVSMGFSLAEIASGDGTPVLQWYPQLLPELAPEEHDGPFDYDSRPSNVSQALSFEDWSGGCGEVSAPPGSVTSRRYSHSQGVDPSWGDRLYRSPERQPLTGISAAPSKSYRSPTFGRYALVGDKVYQFSGGEWVERFDSGGTDITDIIEYGNSTATYLFIALGDSTAMRYSTDGEAFSNVVTSEEASFFSIRGSLSVEPVLWGITTTGALRSTTNPTSSANWSNADQIGSRGETVTAMVVANDLLWIFKEEGIYYFDGLHIGTMVPVSQLRATGNGRLAMPWINGNIYTNYGGVLLEVDPIRFQLRAIWSPAHPELHGEFTALAGDLRYLYPFLKNDDGNTYVGKINPTEGVPHTIAYLGANDCDAAFVDEPGGIHSANPALVFGYGASTADFVLTSGGRLPEDDPAYRFEIGDGTIYGPWCDAGAMVYPKWLNGGRVISERTTAARHISMAYGLDGDTSSTELVDAVSPGLTAESVNSEVEFTRLRYVATLTAVANTHSPRAMALVFDTTPNAPRHLGWRCVVEAEHNQATLGGSNRRLSYREQEAFLLGMRNKRVSLTDPFNRTFTAKVLSVIGLGLRIKAGIGQDAMTGAQDFEVQLAEIEETTVLSNIFTWGESAYGDGSVWGN